MMLRELFVSLAQADQLGRAHQRKVAGVEDQDQPAAAIILHVTRVRDGSGNRVQGRSKPGPGCRSGSKASPGCSPKRYASLILRRILG